MYIISQDKQVIANIGHNCTSVYAYDNEVRVTKIKDIYIKAETGDFDYKLAIYSSNKCAENVVQKIHELVANDEPIFEMP